MPVTCQRNQRETRLLFGSNTVRCYVSSQGNPQCSLMSQGLCISLLRVLIRMQLVGYENVIL